MTRNDLKRILPTLITEVGDGVKQYVTLHWLVSRLNELHDDTYPITNDGIRKLKGDLQELGYYVPERTAGNKEIYALSLYVAGHVPGIDLRKVMSDIAVETGDDKDSVFLSQVQFHVINRMKTGAFTDVYKNDRGLSKQLTNQGLKTVRNKLKGKSAPCIPGWKIKVTAAPKTKRINDMSPKEKGRRIVELREMYFAEEAKIKDALKQMHDIVTTMNMYV